MDRPAHSAKSAACSLFDLRNFACLHAWRERLAAYRAGHFVPVDPRLPPITRIHHEGPMSTDRLPLRRLRELREVAQACVTNDNWTFGPLDEEDLVKALDELIDIRTPPAQATRVTEPAEAAS